MATDLLPDVVSTAELGELALPPTSDGRLRFSREAYHRLVDIGVLTYDSRVELIDGEIYMMSPIGPPQGGYITRLMNFFVKRLPESLICRIQLPIGIGEHSEPEPDLAIVRCRDDDYLRTHPTPSDVVLLIEISQSSLTFDLGAKLHLYAAAGIQEYWVVDISRRVILAHRGLLGGEYRQLETLGVGGTIAPVAAPECKLEVTWLFR